MDNQLTIPNRYHYTTGTPLSNKITATMKERKHLKSKGRQKQTRTLTSAPSQLQITKTIVVTGKVQEILTHIKNVDKYTRDTEQFTLVKPKSA